MKKHHTKGENMNNFDKNMFERIKKIIEGCDAVFGDKKLHKDARDLAKLVRWDCQDLITEIKLREEFYGHKTLSSKKTMASQASCKAL